MTDITASRDLKKLCELELLIPHGERKMRTYSAAPVLVGMRNATRIKRVVDDPYEVVKRRFRVRNEEAQAPRLPGL